MNEYKFQATLKKVISDDDGEGQVILLVPLTEMKNIIGMNLQVHTILNVVIKSE